MLDIDALLLEIAQPDRWGYRLGEPAAAEPTALCALALIGHDRIDAARAALDVLATMQLPNGSVAPRTGDDAPLWATGYAVMAWQAAVRMSKRNSIDASRFQAAVEKACGYLVEKDVRGDPIDPAKNPQVGHNTLLVGWPWVLGTHSWLEPTALAYLALKAAGMRMHPRAVEAVALMVDRLLPDGGCNHGNTFVLGQPLKPHVLPTGLVLLALGGGEVEGDPRIEKSLQYLADETNESTAAASLGYSLMASAAHGRRPADADTRIEQALHRPTLDLGAAGIRRPLLALAALADKSPLVEMTREGMRT